MAFKHYFFTIELQKPIKFIEYRFENILNLVKNYEIDHYALNTPH